MIDLMMPTVPLLPAPRSRVLIADHVGHRWAKDSHGVYCTCVAGQRISLYAHGTCWNSPKRQQELAKAMDTLRALLASSGMVA